MKKTSLFDYDNKPNTYFSATRFEMIPFVPENTKTLLDVGCSNGIFAESIKNKYGAEVWGIEITESAIEEAKKKLDKILVGYLDENLNKLEDKHFDVISFNDVLEHMEDPYDALFKVKNKLSENGVIVASIPNVRYLKNLLKLVLKKEWKYVDDGILDRTHLRFFTKKTIEQMFDDLGFEIVDIKGINSIRGWKACIIKVLSLGFFEDTLHQQFAVVVKIK